MAAETTPAPPVYPVDMTVRHDFRYPPDQCDVRPRQRANLTLYREKRQAWLHLLDGDPEHAIHLQISGMMWADAAYRAMNETRRFATEQCPTAAVAGLLAEALDHGYVATMILAIGKLTEPESGNQDKGVISLCSILGDMRRQRHLMTREIFVCHDGLPYDPASSEERYYRENPIVPGQGRWRATVGPDAFDTAEQVHATFDTLAGVCKMNRSADDLIRLEVFGEIEAHLNAEVVKRCKDLRDKFVAHAATAHSRTVGNIAGFAITLDQIESAQRSLVVADHQIRRDLLWAGAGEPVPIPQFDQFADLDRPFIPTERIGEIHDWWGKHASDQEAWLQ